MANEMVAKCSGDISEIHISGGMPPSGNLTNSSWHCPRAAKSYIQGRHRAIYRQLKSEEWAARGFLSNPSNRCWDATERSRTHRASRQAGPKSFPRRVRQNFSRSRSAPREQAGRASRAHRLGIPSNATIVHMDILRTPEERWTHLELIRSLQDESLRQPVNKFCGLWRGSPSILGQWLPGTFTVGRASSSFIPLAFQPGTTGLAVQPPHRSGRS